MSDDKLIPRDANNEQSDSRSVISRRSLLLGFLIAPIAALDAEPAAAQFGGLLGAVLGGMLRGRGYRRRGGHRRHYASRRRSYRARSYHARSYARARVAHRSYGGGRRYSGGYHGGGGGGGGGGGMGKADF